MEPSRVRLLYCDLDGESGLSLEPLDAGVSSLEIETVEEPESGRERIENARFDAVVCRCEDPERGRSALAAMADVRSSATAVLVSDASTRRPSDSADGRVVDDSVTVGADENVVGALSSYVAENFEFPRVAAKADAGGGGDTKRGSGPERETCSTMDDPSGQLTALAETTSDAIITVDGEGVIRFANPAVEEILGYPPQELVETPLTELMSETLAEEHREAFRRYQETGERRIDWDDIELPGRHADGYEVPLSVSFSEFTHEGTRYFTGVLRDVSERKEREAERALLHDVTRRIARAESFADGIEIALSDVGEAMNWVYGEAWTTGEDGETLLRRDERYVADETYADFHERSQSLAFERGVGLPGRVWESKEPVWLPNVTDAAATPFVRSDLAAEHGLQAVLGVPILADGEVVAVLIFAMPEYRERDEGMVEATSGVATSLGRLMLRKRAEQSLREERNLKTRILETSPIGIVIIDSDGEFEYVNGAARSILGMDPSDEGVRAYDDLGYQPLDENGDPLDESERPYRTVVRTAEPYQGELQVRGPDGKTRWLSIHGTPFESERGDVSKTVFAFEDVTDRKERELELELSNEMLETVRDGVYALDADGRFLAVNRAYADMVGYEREELIGEPATTVTSERVDAELDRLQSELAESETDAITYETTLQTADGSSLPIEAYISRFPDDDGEYGRAGVVRDVSARKRREEQLKQLNEFAQALTTARSATEVCDIAVETARETLDLSITAIERYDEESGRLNPISQTLEAEEVADGGYLFDRDRDPVWETYAEQRGRVLNDVAESTDLAGTTPLRSAIILPVGSFGAFVSGATEPNEFTNQEVTLANIFVANVEAALERVDREAQLRNRKEELEEKAETLERVNRINSVIREITRTLTQASTREEIEQAVCTKLANAEPYEFAWVGKQRTIGGEITPRASAGVGRGYLDSITVTADDTETGRGPAGRAVETHEPQVQNNLHSDPPFEPWRIEAIQRGFRASISVPLRYNDTLYGTLNLYAGEAGIFDDVEVTVLGELGETIGYAINAMERKKALVSESTVQLTLRVDDPEVPAVAFAAQTDSEFDFDALVEQSDGSLRAFFTIADCTPQEAERYARSCPSVVEMNLIAERENGCFYEAVVGTESFLSELLEAGAHPTALTATPDGGRLTVELPRSGDVQAFLATFVEQYDGAELLSRRELDRPVKTEEEFQTLYEERLTEREEEVLRTAFYAGFFDFPRESSASEVAEILDVTQPTISRHVRKGQQKLMNMVFDDEV